MKRLLIFSIVLLFVPVLAACGGGDDDSGGGSSSGADFNIEISGSYEGELTDDNATANFSASDLGDGTIGYQLWFGTGGELTAFVLLGVAPEAGTAYTISSEGFLEGDTANASVLIQQGGMTAANGDGTITFDSVGDTYAGEFTFTAVDPMDEAFEISVTGTFSEIPTLETGVEE